MISFWFLIVIFSWLPNFQAGHDLVEPLSSKRAYLIGISWPAKVSEYFSLILELFSSIKIRSLKKDYGVLP